MSAEKIHGSGISVMQWGEHPISDFGGSSLAVQVNPAQPALLIASLVVDNQEGRRSNDQHTIAALARIEINGALYACDYSAYYVWDGVASANATCHTFLKAGGRYNILAKASSSQSHTTKGLFSYSVLLVAEPFPAASEVEAVAPTEE